jgi:hypothetical protein
MKKKHDLPLTEDMLNELNKTSLSGGYSGSGSNLKKIVFKLMDL